MSKKIFISHASKDKKIADAFVDVILHGALSVPITEIFCVSTDGTKIRSGDDWRNSIKENIISAKVNFLLISPHYKESEVCMNEMGAAWMTNATVLPLIIEPINYNTVGIIQEPNQIEKLLDEKSLDRIKDIVQEELEIESKLIKSDRWTAKKKEFMIKIQKHLSSNPFETPINRESFKQLTKDKADLESTINNLIEEKSELESLVLELKEVKDKNEVKVILKKRRRTNEFDEFLELCKKVKKLLDHQPSIINGIIFKSYSGKDVNIGWERHKDELDEAYANDFISQNLEPIWNSTKEMKNIYQALINVSEFMSRNLKENFFNLYEEQYEVPLDMGNKKFWEEVFEVPISLK